MGWSVRWFAPPPPWIDVLVSWFPFKRPEKEIASILEKYGEVKSARFQRWLGLQDILLELRFTRWS